MTEYQRTLEWLYALEAAKGMDFKLERVALALQRLGDPHRRFRSLHIAGTNGKGSVAAMLHASLAAAGYRTGLYTSPHLVDLTERIRVGDAEINREEVVELTAKIRSATGGRGIDLTFFEFLTVMAFVYFARQTVDVAVVEVGLGGRLDATNVVDPTAAAITTIGLDHVQWLGDTLPAIAAEKGGIIKPGRPVVLGQIAPPALAVLHRLAAERGAAVVRADADYRVETRSPTAIDFEGLGWRLSGVSLGLRGLHQHANAGTAIAVLAAAREALPIGAEAIREGLSTVRWPGRLDIVSTAPLTILDGAHNLDGVTALAGELPALLGGRPMHLLFAVMGDKDWRPMAERLAPLCASVVVTEVLPPRGAPAAAVADAFRPYCPVVVELDPVDAWRHLAAATYPDEAIVAAGSLFLVGALYATVLPAGLRPGEARGTLHP